MSAQGMSPEEILANLEVGAARREQAGAELVALLKKLAGAHHLERASKEVFVIDPEDRAEVVDRAVVRVIENSPLPVVGKSNGECVNYLKRILLNLYLDLGRHRRHHKEHTFIDDSVDSLSEQDVDNTDAGAELLSASRDLLTRLVRGMCDRTRNEDDREKARRSWAQIVLLVYENGDMMTILERDEHVDTNAPHQVRVKARNRVLTQHKRFREKLGVTIDVMAASGELSANDAELARLLLKNFLLRRQNSGDGPSTDT